ncbi:MAG: hypothetical protein CHACPFDD_03729 [Phycisphaerae bacterium]|nr:hypothetical protein [Phycisphaerae bacterium]
MSMAPPLALLSPITSEQQTAKSAALDVVLGTTLFAILGYYVEPWLVWRIPADVVPDDQLALAIGRAATSSVLILVAAAITRGERLPLRTLGLRRSGFSRCAVWVAATTAGALLATWCVGLAFNLITRAAGLRLEPARAVSPLSHASSHPVLPLLALFLCSVPGEEFLFRGLLMTRLRRLSGTWLGAILLNSALFGLTHLVYGNVRYAFAAFVLSLVLSVAFVACGDLLIVSAAHLCFNVIQMCITWALRGA